MYPIPSFTNIFSSDECVILDSDGVQYSDVTIKQDLSAEVKAGMKFELCHIRYDKGTITLFQGEDSYTVQWKALIIPSSVEENTGHDFHVVITTANPNHEQSSTGYQSKSFATLEALKEGVREYVVEWFNNHWESDSNIQNYTLEDLKKDFFESYGSYMANEPISAFYFDRNGEHSLQDYVDDILRDEIKFHE